MPRISRNRQMQFSLGWELEAETRARNIPSQIESGYDGSVRGDAVEYKIRPQYVNNPDQVLSALKELTADQQIRVGRSCGFHVHIGLQTNSNMSQTWASWMVTLARSLESVAFEAVPESRRNNQYCARWTTGSHTGSVIEGVTYSRSKTANRSRYYWVNVVEMFRPGGIRTVEIRLLGNTRRFSYLLGWTSVSMLMAKAAWRLVFDPSLLQVELRKMEDHFKQIKTNILPNNDAQICQSTANRLAMDAGFTVRADVIAAPQRRQTARMRDNANVENDIFTLSQQIRGLGLAVPTEFREGSRIAYRDELRRILNAQHAPNTSENAPELDLSGGTPSNSTNTAQTSPSAFIRALNGYGFDAGTIPPADRLRFRDSIVLDGMTFRDAATNERLDRADVARRLGMGNTTERRNLSCVE